LDINLIIPLITAALAGGLTGILGAVVALRRLPIERKAADIDGAAQLTGAAMEVVKQVRDELVRTEENQNRLEQEHRALMADFERLRNDLIKADQRFRKMEAEDKELKQRVEQLEIENQQLRQVNHDLVKQLSNEQDKRKALEEKLDTLIENGQGGQRSEPP